MKSYKNDTEKRNVAWTLFTHVIHTYHKKPYRNVVKNILMQETSNNAVVNQYKEAG